MPAFGWRGRHYTLIERFMGISIFQTVASEFTRTGVGEDFVHCVINRYKVKKSRVLESRKIFFT